MITGMRRHVLWVGLLVVVAGFVGACTTPTATPTAPRGEGTVEGRFHIGPLCPIEPCPFEPSNPYVGRWAALTPNTGPQITAPLSAEGTFSVRVPVGTYALALVDCPFLGCSNALPQRLAVGTDRVTTVDVRIDTGIR